MRLSIASMILACRACVSSQVIRADASAGCHLKLVLATLLALVFAAMCSTERWQRWEAAQEAHVVATIALIAHQSELLLSTLPRHAAALAQAATSTTRAGGEVAELQQAVRALSLRTVAEQLRL